MACYVINLERRSDRKESMINRFELFAPRLPLHFFKAIDGTDKLPESKFLQYINNNNDFENNPRIIATILSHLSCIEQVANGVEPYGFIFEDDLLFREDALFRRNFKSFEIELKKLMEDHLKKNKFPIIYAGVGDVLPIHLEIPSESLLRAVEKSHVSEIIFKYFGKPRTDKKSPYVFDWLGAFSYIIPKFTAQKLLETLSFGMITNAFDVFLKNFVDNNSQFIRYFTAPLLTYHPVYNTNIHDSDTLGIAMPMNANANVSSGTSVHASSTKEISFIIPTYYRHESLQRTVESIIDNANGGCRLKFIICYHPEDLDTKLVISELRNCYSHITIISVTTTETRLELHKIYNSALGLCKESDYVAVWDDDTVLITDNWVEKLLMYSKIILHDCPNAIASFQFKFRDEFTINNFMLTKRLVSLIDEISPCANVRDYLKYVTYLSKINIYTRDILIEKIKSDSDISRVVDHELINKLFMNNSLVKDSINNLITKIVNDPYYKACGIWIKFPKDWKTTDTIEGLETLVK
jgi:GR25 family glycosyltransferase involved in LPS biosynthesis